MVSKLTFIVAIVCMAFVVGALACFGWMHGHAWWRRREQFGNP
jgi:hypothetical protein